MDEPVPWTPEVDRVANLDRRPRPEPGTPEAAELVETVTRWHARSRPDLVGVVDHDCKTLHGKPCVTRLRIEQAWTLFEIGLMRGAFGFIAPGVGKTLIEILAPMALEGCRLAVLLVPAPLASQFAKMYRHAAEHWCVPDIRIYGSEPWSCQKGRMPDGSERPRLCVVPYSMLSGADASVFLENIRPDLIMGDECHMLADPTSARTRRLLRYAAGADDAGLDVRYAFWSGTPTESSVMDYHHLMILALRERAPLPTDPDDAEVWASAIDPGMVVAPPGALREALCLEGEHVQDGYYRRLVETPGVISTVEAATDVQIVVRARTPEIPDDLLAVMNDVRRTWMRPDGMKEFEDKIEQWRCLYELACGFYLRWRFPRGESDTQIDRWVSRQKDWNRAVREVLKLNRPRMDSPLLCKRAAIRALANQPDTPDAPAWDCPEWEPWSEVEGTVRPVTEAVWLSDFVLEDLSEWLREEPSIAWYDSVDLGRRLAEVSGFEQYAGGPGAGDKIDGARAGRSIVASVRSHGTGRDGLQFKFRRNAFPQPFASPAGYEQAISRIARPGQPHPTVDVLVYDHTPELRKSTQTARDRAAYVQRTTGARQKLLSPGR
jgi:hypothetical protein